MSPLSQPQVLDHLQITGVLSQTYTTLRTKKFHPFSNHPSIHLSHNTMHIYFKQPYTHYKILSQSNINRKPLTHIHSYQDANPIIYIKTLRGFQQFSSNSIHFQHLPNTITFNRIIHLFQIHKHPKYVYVSIFDRFFSQACLTGNTN